MRKLLNIIAVLMLLSGCSSFQSARIQEPESRQSVVDVLIKSTPIWPGYLGLYLSMLLPELYTGYNEGRGEHLRLRAVSEDAKQVMVQVSEFLIEHARKHDVDTSRKPFDKWSSDEMFAFFLHGFGRYPVGVELGAEFDYLGLLKKVIERNDSHKIIPYCQLLLAYLLETEGFGWLDPSPKYPGPDALRAIYREVVNNKNAPDCLKASALASLLTHEGSEKARKRIARRIVREFAAFRSWPFYQLAQDTLAK